MTDRARRTFLGQALTAAGWTLAAGAAGPAAAAPSGRFLDAVAAGDVGGAGAALAADPGLLHARDVAGRSAYAVALLERRPDVAALLLERGYRPDLHEAALAVDWERFESLAAAGPGLVNRDHPIGGTAMYAAAYGGAGSSIWRVYAAGGEPDLAPRGPEGHTPLRAALEHPDLGTAELTAASLLANDADPAGPEAGGDSALHAAARRGSVDLVEMLLRKGADPEARDAEGATPLDRALAAGRDATARLLRDHRSIPRDHSTSRRAYAPDGGPYRTPDLSDFDPLVVGRVVGSSHFDLAAVRRAVERHPELAHAVATTGEGAVEAGAHTGHVDIVEALLERGAPYSLPTAVVRGDLSRVRELLDADPRRIHERGPHDFALLWYPVIAGGRLDLAEVLLDRGAEPERQHFLGTTALHFAARAGQADMAALLLERGADPARRGRKFSARGETPLELAAAAGHDGVVALLRAAPGAR